MHYDKPLENTCSIKVFCMLKCPRNFCNKGNPAWHFKKIHGSILRCLEIWRETKCELSFWDKCKLHRHVERHEKDESFECTICSFIFRKEEVYLKHWLYHTGERKHWCSTCFQAFDIKDNSKSTQRGMMWIRQNNSPAKLVQRD